MDRIERGSLPPVQGASPGGSFPGLKPAKVCQPRNRDDRAGTSPAE
jgi:hypothetical protein